MNGAKKNEKEIRAFVADLNIQTDNLCQFLPQDKVYEFSRMTPKDLLHRTVDAVGEEQLQSDHRKLQEMQNFVEDAEARYTIQSCRKVRFSHLAFHNSALCRLLDSVLDFK